MTPKIKHQAFIALCVALLASLAIPARFASGNIAAADPPPWVKMAVIPTQENLNAVTASSKRSIWFAGDNGVVLNWTGVSFKSYKVELPDGVRLTDIHMFSSGDGWAVGYNTANNYGRIYHFDGSSWKLFTEEGIRGVKFRGLAFLGRQDGLLVGEGGQLYRWDGRTWTDKTSAILSGSAVDSGRLSLVTDVEADPDAQIYLLACHYRTRTSPDRTDSVYVRLDLKTERAGIFYNTPTKDSLTYSGAGRLGAFPGGRFHYLSNTALYTFSHGVSTYGKAGVREFQFNLNQGILRGMWLFGREDGWFVGDSGAVIRLQPGPKSETFWPVGERLNAVWMNDPDFGFIAGDKGTILMRNTAAGVILDIDADKLEYDFGEQVVLGVYRVSQAATATISLKDAKWEIKQETTTDERKSFATVYTSPASSGQRGGQSLTGGQVLALLWDQKDDQGRQVKPGTYHAYFRGGGASPGLRFTIRQPVEKPPSPGQGGITLDLPSVYPLADIVFKLTNRDAKAADLAEASYAVDRKEDDGWHRFYASKERSVFQPGRVEGGKSYEWTWKRWDSTGKKQAGEGQYRLVVTMPGNKPDRATKEFDLKAQAGTRNK